MRTGRPLLLLAGLWTGAATAQELVSNGGFEEYTACPDYISQVERATGWSRPTEGTSDYLNSCATDPFASVPSNQFGDQPAHSGEAYVGLYAFSWCYPDIPLADGYREYATHALASPMVPGQVYQVEFYVSLGEVGSYAVNDLGALFSMEPPHRFDDQWIRATPQVSHGGVSWLDDHDGWTAISGCFVADSAYAWITIGSFNSPEGTEFVLVPPVGNPFCYYFIDDVSVKPGLAVDLGPDVETCGPVQLSVVDPQDGIDYIWSTGDTATSITVAAGGVYRVSADEAACTVEDSVRVTYRTPFAITLAPDTAVDLCATPTVRLEPDTLPVNATVHWSTGVTQPWITVMEPGTYTIAVSGPDVCPTEASITLTDLCAHPVFSPNAFSPNGDGINDVWRPVWRSNPDGLVELEVFDRWGRVLYSASDGRIGWNGEAGGGPVPDGTYAFRLYARDRGAQVNSAFSGHVTLVR